MDNNALPHLTTVTADYLHLLERQLLLKQKDIENWFAAQWQLTTPPVYGSVDLRNAGFKLAPIDMNLFPAGFNNLSKTFLNHSVQAARESIVNIAPDAKKILLIPENHTRNIFYWENIQTLMHTLTEANFIVKLGTLLPDALIVNDTLQIEPVQRVNHRIQLNDFVPDLILLNNDLSSGIPDMLADCQQPIVPPAKLGWSERLKSEHFQYYEAVSNEFAKMIDIDPWFIAPLFRHCGKIDFMKRDGEECLTKNVEQLLRNIQKKYDEYKIKCKPFVIVKADSGTYGMAVMTVRSAEEVQALNRKQRTSMAKTKSGQPVRRVIVQEGVYTFETWGSDNAVAEPVVYLWGQRVVGGFYRVHKERGIDENLNAPGMQFEPLAFETPCDKPDHQAGLDHCQNRYYAYGVIARLSMLAAAREIRAQKT